MVDPLPVVLGQPQFQGGQRGNGSGQADKPRAPPRRQRWDRFGSPSQLLPDCPHGVGHLRCRGRVPVQEALREPDAAHVEGHREDLSLGLGHDLRRAAANVEDDDGRVRYREIARCARVRQPALFDSWQELRRRADDLGRREEEGLAVCSVPHCGGGDQPSAADLLGIHDGAIGPKRGKRTLHGLRPQPAGTVHALAEARDRHLSGTHLARGPDHEQAREFVPHRSRQAHRRVSRRRVSQRGWGQVSARVRSKRAATQSPTTSSPPASHQAT